MEVSQSTEHFWSLFSLLAGRFGDFRRILLRIKVPFHASTVAGLSVKKCGPAVPALSLPSLTVWQGRYANES